RLNARPHFVWRMGMADDHDVVAHAPRPTERLSRCARDPNWWMRLLHRSRVECDFFELPELALVIGALSGPGFENDLVCFFHAGMALLPRNSKYSVIERRIARPDAEFQPAAGNGVYHGVVLGGLQRMTQRRNGNACSKANSRGPGGCRGEHNGGVGDEPAVAQEMMFVEHEAFKA